MICNLTIQDKKVTFHYIFLQFYPICFTYYIEKIVHYNSEKSDKCKCVLLLGFCWFWRL